ncbi:unnamed protein product [Rhizoctonia solani]|uniref:Uncharacterized protein n=1 Tax=Rhizoctonia solani TaxID=456999 RepID=A0A8H2XV11_9AGAM|nr:unnamed protein product [Rhizoctonia solani]
MTSQQQPWSTHTPTHYQQPSTDSRGVENYLASQQQQQQAGYSQPQQSTYPNQQLAYSNQQPGYPQQPISTYTPPAPAYAQSQPQGYSPNSAYSQQAPTLPPPPPHGANRQMSLPPNLAQGPSTFTQPPYGHVQQPTDTSVEALDLAEYSARLNAHQQYAQTRSGYGTPPQNGYSSYTPPAYPSNPQSAFPQSAYSAHPQPGYGTPPNGYAYGAQHQSQPTSAYPSQPATNYQSQPTTNYQPQPAHQTQPASSNYNPKPSASAGTANVGDFIDVGPFTYSGIREMSPPPRRQESPQRPQRQESPQRPRHESPLRHESPQRPPVQSPPPRGHLPWASENTDANERDIGDPDLVYPPSTPHRNDANSFPFNVQAAQEAASQASNSPEERNQNETSYFSPDPEAQSKQEGKKDWGVRDGEWGQPGDLNEDGKLVSNGPRKRMAVRALEVLSAIGVVIACIYAFAVPKPNPAAPPASKPAVYVMVVLGFGTIFVFAYIYIIRGLFGVGVNKDDPYAHAMVLPISRHRPGQSKKHGNQSSVQVNLVVPSALSPQRESNITPGVAWSEQQTSSNNVFTSYEREKARLAARKGLWWALGLDVLGALVWGTAFVLAMVGPRCPVGGYSGWCDAFNGAVACSCIGCALFIVSGVLVGRDLFASRKTDRKLGRY